MWVGSVTSAILALSAMLSDLLAQVVPLAHFYDISSAILVLSAMLSDLLAQVAPLAHFQQFDGG